MAMSREARTALQGLLGAAVGGIGGGMEGAAYAGAGAVDYGMAQSQLEQRDRALANQERGTALREMAMELQSRDFDFRRQVHQEQAKQYNNQMLLQLYQLPGTSDEFKLKVGQVLTHNVKLPPEDFALRLDRNEEISRWMDAYLKAEDPNVKNELWKKIQVDHPELANVDHNVMARLEGLAVDKDNIKQILRNISEGRALEMEGGELLDAIAIMGELSDKELALLGLHDNVSIYQDAYWRRQNEITGQQIDIGDIMDIAKFGVQSVIMDDPTLVTQDRMDALTYAIASQMSTLIRGLSDEGIQVNTGGSRLNPDGTITQLEAANQQAFDAAKSGVLSGYYKDIQQIVTKLEEKGFKLTPGQKAELDTMFIERDAQAGAPKPGGE